MPLLQAEAAKLTQDEMRQGVIETIITSDDLFGVAPFKNIAGKAYVYNQEKTLSEPDFLDVDDPVQEGAATFEEQTAVLKRLIGDVDVDNFLQSTYDNVNDQTAIQIEKKTKATARKFANYLINGDVTVDPKSFDGLLKLLAPSQSLLADPNGAALSFGHLDWLMDAAKVDGQRTFIMHSRTIRAYLALLRAFGGTQPETVTLPNYGRPILAYRGIPILKNDWIPTDQVAGTETAATTVLLASWDEEDGVTGLTGGEAAGVSTEFVGTVQDKDAKRWRVKWYCGLANHNDLALAGVTGINN